MRKKTPTVIQMEQVECGAAALTIVLGYYGRYVPLEEMRVACGVSRDGSNALKMIEAAKSYGLEGKGLKLGVAELEVLEEPAILLWDFSHFVVLEGFGKGEVYINNPSIGPTEVSLGEFEKAYAGIAITFEKMESFQEGGSPPSFLKSIWQRVEKIPKSLSFLLLTGLCLLVPGFAMPALLTMFIDVYFGQGNLPWKWEFMGAVLATAVFSGVMIGTQQYVLNRLKTQLSITFSSNFLWHLLHLPLRFYTQRHPAEVSYRTSLNEMVADVLTGPMISTAISALLVIFYGLLMFNYDAVIASIALLSAFINLASMQFVFRSRETAYARLQQDISQQISTSIGGLQYIETIKAKGSEETFFQKWAHFFTKALNSRQEIGKKDVLLTALPPFFQFATLALLLGIGSFRILEGSLSIGKLMALQLLLTNFLQPINRFIGFTSLLQTTKVNIDRLDDVLKNEIDPMHALRSIEKSDKLKLEGKLEFRNVTFRYSPFGVDVIRDLSFVLEPGQRIAFVGPVGSGKSTVAKLALGLYDPTSGQILYDGMPIEKIPNELFRNSVAGVDQEIFLFAGSIRDNLCFWNSKVPDEALVEAAKDAEIHEEILLRSGGYDALLIEEGKNLSGGQRQRLEIARALLYHPALVILDEATSALDSTTEKAVSNHLERRGCSMVIVAHRLSTIQDCDQIIVLEQGEVAQRGTHEELKKIPGIYQELVERELHESH